MAKRILIIDDDADLRELIQVSLELKEGWQVLTAASGEEGVALASETLPDAVLLDVRMPGMDGPTTFFALRAERETRQIPVIMLTANMQADARYATELQLSGVITKPFDPYRLADQVAGLLGWGE